MDAKENAAFLSLASCWPIAISLATYLPAGDLINLARCSVPLRAALHGFNPPSAADLLVIPESKPRPFLCIGRHQTAYWKQLKRAAPFVCASPTHTKGSTPQPCRFCSTPICEACIVKDSFAKGTENTFKNRCRFLCKDCWNYGNPHRRCRFTGEETSARNSLSRYNFAPGEGEFCGCTNKDDGWVCISCKDMQNTEANTNGFKLCFGEECTATLEEDKDRRRICLWCDRPMLRGRASMESRIAFVLKMQDARAKRGLSFEGRPRKQQKLLKMSRRELRGNEAVAQDPMADTPQFVRNFDTVNYQRYLRREQTPTANQVYQSKLGRWVYNREFLLAIGKRCKGMQKRTDVRELTKGDGEQLQRTNFEGTDLEDWRWRFEKYTGKEAHQAGGRPVDQDDDAISNASRNFTHDPVRGTGSGRLAEETGSQDLEKSFSFRAEGKATKHKHAENPEGDFDEEMADDRAIALALQAEFDQEMAEAMEAEFVAAVGEEVDFTSSDGQSEESDMDDEYSISPVPTCNTVSHTSTSHHHREDALQSQGGVAAKEQSQTQMNMTSFERTSNFHESQHPIALRRSSSLLTSDKNLDFTSDVDETSKPGLLQGQPDPDVHESNNGTSSQSSVRQLLAQPAQDDQPPPYAG